MANAHVRFKDVHKSFPGNPVLSGVDFWVDRGECLSIIGGSGCGKSVSFKCLLGLMKIDSGEIWVDDICLSSASHSVQDQVRSQIGVLFQNAALFDSLTVLENVAFGLIQNGTSRTEAEKISLQKLDQVNLKREVASLYPEALSGGMRKRVGIARAIATEPSLLLFDEPTSGLDPIMSDVINNLILSCVRELGSTAIVITHDMKSCRKLSNKALMLYQGKVVWSGTHTDIEKTDNPYLKQFMLGESEGPIVI